MTTLVTGAAGYIGSHFLLQHALRDSSSCIAYDNLSTGFTTLLGNVPLISGDIRDENLLISTMKEHSVTEVVHFAASCIVSESVKEPATYYDNNLRGTLTLLNAMRKAGVKRIVFSSSCATYGIPKTQAPMTEATEQKPINPYGHSKLVCERMLDDFRNAYGLQFVALRYFNAAGADALGRAGEMHEHETHLIPLVLAAAQDESKSLFIYGTDYDTPDGTCIRDYVHVTDIADAHVLALDYLNDGGPSDYFNIGSESGFSVLQVVEECQRITGRKIKMNHSSRRDGDPPVLVSSSQKVQKSLGWQCKHSSLPEIVNTAWQWANRAAVKS